MANTSTFINALSRFCKDYSVTIQTPTSNSNHSLLATLTHETTSINVILVNHETVLLDMQPFINDESLYVLLRLIHVSLASLPTNTVSVYFATEYSSTHYYGAFNDRIRNIQNPITLANSKGLLMNVSPELLTV